MSGIAGLDEDGLPDAALRAIPALLAMRDLRKIGATLIAMSIRQAGQDLDGILRLQESGWDHEFERKITAFVTTDLSAVDEDSGQIADGTEADGDFPSRPFYREREGPAIGCRSEADGEILETSLPVRRHLCMPPFTIGLVAELPAPIKRKRFAERRVRWGERLGIGVHRLSLEDRLFRLEFRDTHGVARIPAGDQPLRRGWRN